MINRKELILITANIRQATKCNGDYSIYLTFPYDERIIDKIRVLPERHWDRQNKDWEIPLRRLSSIVCMFANYDLHITGYIEEAFAEKEIDNTIDFNFKTTPFNHQKEGFIFGMNHESWLLADEQGLGKTKQVIDIATAKKEKENFNKCLIVCGVNSLKWNWANEINTHSNETAHILGQKVVKQKLRIGSNKDKLADLNNIDEIDSYFLITNVESLRDKDIANKLGELCKNKTISMVAIDEIHKCFDYDTLITTSLGKLKIGDIVTNKIQCDVISFNETTQSYENKPIINYYENPIFEEMLELTIETTEGIRNIQCTKNHLFYTNNRGWVTADDLTEFDDIAEYLDTSYTSVL